MLCCVVQVDFPVEPGDRLLLQVVEVDVPAGHYRLTVAVSVLTVAESVTAMCWAGIGTIPYQASGCAGNALCSQHHGNISSVTFAGVHTAWSMALLLSLDATICANREIPSLHVSAVLHLPPVTAPAGPSGLQGLCCCGDSRD